MTADSEDTVSIPVDDVELEGKLDRPADSSGLVVFAHGSGSSRKSPRNNYVADVLRDRGLGTLLFDLLTEAEDRVRENRFDIQLLTGRLLGVTEWVRERDDARHPNVGYFGASTGAAAALRAAARPDVTVDAVVSRGGRVDMASEVFDDVPVPTLLIVGGADTQVLGYNREADDQLSCETELHVVDGAGHLFQGEGELEAVAAAAADFFEETLQ